MSVFVYRGVGPNIEKEKIEPAILNKRLAEGWRVERNEPVVTAPTMAEADTNNTGKLSTQEVREAARTAGIEGWENKRIGTLKKELNYA
jgi:hypothetical protein